MRLSIVRKTSNWPESRRRSSPFFMPAQPAWGTVITSWPVSSSASSRGRHSSRRMRNRVERLSRNFECRDCLVAADGGKGLQKIVQTVASLQAVDQILHRHASTDKNRSAAENIRIAMDDLGFVCHLEAPI